jgi:hypothetical protein
VLPPRPNRNASTATAAHDTFGAASDATLESPDLILPGIALAQSPFYDLRDVAPVAEDVSDAVARHGPVSADASDQSLVTLVLRRGLPCWLVSLVAHLSLILLLSLISLRAAGPGIINLFADPIESSEPFVTLDTVLDEPEDDWDANLKNLQQPRLAEPLEVLPTVEESLTAAFDESMSEGLGQELLPAGGPDGEASGGKFADTGAEFFGVTGDGSRFIFIVDCSGSMSEFGRWDRAVRELKKSISELSVNQRFLILLYNNNYVSMNNPPDMVPATELERRTWMEWLDRNYPEGWTFCSQALSAALSLKPDAIFLLSDGEFTDRSRVFDVLKKQNKKGTSQRPRRQIPIHTFALGSHKGTASMKWIAKQNNGIFTLVDE